MYRFLLNLLFLLICASAAAFSFPALTGRVVDAAHMLSPSSIQNLDQSLAAYEQESSNQVVVATIPSLQGGTIEDYGYQLGRFWGIGQKGKDNGVILIVAPSEHKTRIEVGYGLEGTLTDALSNQIIQDVILPDFRQGQMERGVTDGAQAIVTALKGESTFGASTKPYPASAHNASNPLSNLVILFLILAWLIFRIFVLPWWFPTFLPFRSGGGFGSGFGGGFSGGGGSFGGGGASGGW